MIDERTLNQMVDRILSVPELSQASIIFYGNGQCRSLYEGPPPYRPHRSPVMVVIEETPGFSSNHYQGFAQEPIQGPSPERNREETSNASPAPVLNESRVGAELVGTGLSCGAAVLSAIAVIGGVAGELPSGGTSTFLVVAAWGGLVTNGIQCINGIVRSYEAISFPEENSLQEWDNNDGYSNRMLFVDAVGLMFSVASLPNSIRHLMAALRQHGRLAPESMLRAMPKSERERVLREAFYHATRTQSGQRAVIEGLKEAGVSSRNAARWTGQMTRYRVTPAPSTFRQANQATQVLSREATRRLNSHLTDILIESVGYVANAMPDDMVGVASGTLNFTGNIIVHAYQQDL